MVEGVTASSVVGTYLEYLGDDEFEAAADQFTEDVEYYHPPTFEGVRKVDGRDALVEYFAETRGPRDHDHEIVKEVNDGNAGVVVGDVTGGEEDGNKFVAYAELDGDKISRYVAGVNVKPE